MAVDTALKNMYFDNIQLLVQQLAVKVANKVFQKPNCSGEVAYQDQMPSVDANEKMSRNEVVVNEDPDYRRRKLVPRYFYKAPLIDSMDKLMLMKDPTSEVVQTNGGALARAKDTVVCNAFFDTAYGGKDGNTAYTLPSSQIIVHSSAGLNMSKLREAQKKLDANEVAKEDRYFVLSAEQVEDLLAIEQATSSDYAQVKAIVQGQPGTINGFEFIQIERLPSSGTTRYCAAFQKKGMVLGSWIDLKASIDILPTVHFSAQVYAGQSYAATRLQEELVVKVECTE